MQTNLYYYHEKEYTHMNKWIAGKDLTKHHCLTNNILIATCGLKALVTKIIIMDKMYGIPLT